MKNKAFGLDIGTTTIKAVWLSLEKSGYLLNASAVSPAPPSGMLSDSPVDQEQMAQTIRKIVSDANITTKYVNIALPETQVYTKVIEMPVLSEKELSSAIYWEAEQHIPISLENLTFDYQILKKAPNDPKMQVLLVGAPNAIIQKYQRVISGAGLILSSVETEILGILRPLVVDHFPTTLIVNIGALNTSFALIKQGVLIFTYSIAMGGGAITRSIATDFNFSISQAEEYKKTYGISPKNLEGKISKAAEPILLAILSEVKKAIAFYKERYESEGPITQIVLSGGGAKLPGLNVYVTQQCGIETVLANPWKVIQGQEIPKEMIDNAPDYTLAVGLAMR